VTLTINTGVTTDRGPWAAARALWSTCSCAGPSGRRAHVRWQGHRRVRSRGWRKTLHIRPPSTPATEQDAHRNIRYAGSTATTAQVDQLLRGAGLTRRDSFLSRYEEPVGWGAEPVGRPTPDSVAQVPSCPGASGGDGRTHERCATAHAHYLTCPAPTHPRE
jgi:hypothetical protein